MEKKTTPVYRKHPDVWKRIEATHIYKHGPKLYWFFVAVVAALASFALLALAYFVPRAYEINAWASVAIASIVLLIIMIAVRHVVAGTDIRVRKRIR